MPDNYEAAMRKSIYSALRRLYGHRKQREEFVPGKTRIQYAVAIYDDQEVESMLDAILDGWFGMGKRAAKFEEQLSSFLGLRGAAITNSGSSANLLAVSSFCTRFPSDVHRFRPGDEVITSSATFPTTVNPIFQNGLVPVFIDADPKTFNLNPDHLQRALSKRTRGIMIPHMLGIPNDMKAIIEFSEKNDLVVIEDTCDALGSKFNRRYVGTFGAVSTFSFYAAHHISMGEGGALASRNEKILEAARSLRDWGRALDVKDKAEHLRGKKLPSDYELRYVYTTIGYNLKPTEIQAAKGLVQLKRLPGFVEARKRNYKRLREGLSIFERYFEFAEPPPSSDVSWFAFPLTVKDGAPFTRKEIRDWLHRSNIDTRQMLAGNIIDHPAYEGLRFRLSTPLRGSDHILGNSFFFGVHPGLRENHLSYIINSFRGFMKQYPL